MAIKKDPRRLDRCADPISGRFPQPIPLVLLRAFNAHSATFATYGGREYNDRRRLGNEELRIAEVRDK